MILVWIVGVPFVAGFLAWIAARWGDGWPRWISLCAAAAGFIMTLSSGLPDLNAPRQWIAEFNVGWIPQFGIRFHLAMDGLSLLLVALTFFLSAISVLASWKEIRGGSGFFHMNLMWITAGIAAVFLAIDLFLFFFAWEVMLIPMYFLIAIWGHERRVYAAIKFFIFTQFSGLLMLIAILALYFAHGSTTGTYSFEYADLLGTALSPVTAFLIMLGFFAAFAVKLPVFLLHTWLPDAHTEAPTAGSIILAGLMLKTGAYGLIRFAIPLFPDASRAFAPVVMGLGVAGILYGAILAFAQTDFKRLVAYTSVSHLGFVLIGIYAWNALALQGAVVTMIAHGVSTGALFMLVGALQDRIHTREFQRMGGIWTVAPAFGGATMVFVMASIGLPGLADFVGEFLTLFGAWPAWHLVAILGAVGILAATTYGLKIMQQAFFGPNANNLSFPDLSGREWLMSAVMIGVLFWLGLFPGAILNTFSPALNHLQPPARIAAITRRQP